MAYVAIDVDPSSMPASAGTEPTKRVLDDDDGDGDSTYDSSGIPTRTASGTALALDTQHEYDALGRRTLTIGPDDKQHVTKYYTNGVARFPYVTGTTAGLPVQVTLTNDAGVRQKTLSIKASQFATNASSIPTAASSFTSRTDYDYDDVNGRLETIDRYHDADGSTRYDDYYRTSLLYDSQGRRVATVQDVASGKFQLTTQAYDVLGRVTTSKRAAPTTAPTTYSAALSAATTVAETIYDAGGVGDGHVTSTKTYHTEDGGTPDDYTYAKYYRTYRGHLRSVQTFYNGDGTGNATAPYSVRDVDWMGRTTATASYSEDTAATWPDDYSKSVVGSTYESNRFNLAKTHYDTLGRVYRTERFPGTQSTKHLRNDNYYDRNGRLVATGDPHSAAQEYVYDGVGRRIETRTVLELNSTKYVSGAFDYRDPDGDGEIVQLSQTVYNSKGYATEQHTFEVNHDDFDHGGSGTDDGLNINGSDCVRSTMHYWYDDAGRVEATANFGCGNGSSSDDEWKFNTAPTYNTTAPTTSTAHKLVTLYTYNPESGRQETVKTWQDTSTTNATKTFYDDFGRRTFVAENWDDFVAPDTDIGGGTNNDADRVTGFTYNGLGKVTTLTAYNASSSTSDQVTTYTYANDYNASLVTKTQYPDGDATDDNVQVTYNLDGSVSTRKDQRGVVMTYTYDDARRVVLEAATTIPGSVDDSVQSIGRSYDTQGRAYKVTSYNEAVNPDAGDIVNEIQYSYTSYGRLQYAYQAHNGATSGSSPKTYYIWDTDADGTTNAYNDGLRLFQTRPPLLSNAKVHVWYGSNNSYNDRMHLAAYRKQWDNGLRSSTHSHTVWYEYNGTGRVAALNSSTSGVQLKHFGATSGEYEDWDRFGRVKQQVWKKSGSPIDQFDYTYDYAGNRLSRDIPSSLYSGDDRDQVYAYDGLNRLSQMNEGTRASGEITDANADFRQKWTLDQLGNWGNFLQDGEHDHSSSANNDFTDTEDQYQDRAHIEVNEITAISADVDQANWQDPSYDAAGNMTNMPNPLKLKTDNAELVAEYDAWNRLVSTDNGDDVQMRFEYDGLHRRIQKTVGSGMTDVVTAYYYNEQWQCILETIDGTVDTYYMWHPYYVDAMAVRMRGNGHDDEHYFTHDANFSVTAATNASGSVVERYAYTPYGEATILDNSYGNPTTSSAIDNEHLYTGRRTDPETGLQLNRYRFLHSGLGRWVNRDPLEYEGLDMNLYGYVGGMPMKFVDPSGTVKILCRFKGRFGGEQIVPVDCTGFAENCCASVDPGFGWIFDDWRRPTTPNWSERLDWTGIDGSLDETLDYYMEHPEEMSSGFVSVYDGATSTAGWALVLAGGVYIWQAAGGATYGVGLITTSESTVAFQVGGATYIGTEAGVVVLSGESAISLGFWSVTGIPILSETLALGAASGPLWWASRPCLSRAAQGLAGGWTPWWMFL